MLDNMFTGRKENIAHWFGHTSSSSSATSSSRCSRSIYHPRPASPPHYQYNRSDEQPRARSTCRPRERVSARCCSPDLEVYGDPAPAARDVLGPRQPDRPRACYDEGKRVAETMMYSYKSQANVEVRVARIFNTFGPRMHPNDGRVVSNFIIQALQGRQITIYGNGLQTRSFQYVEDLVYCLHRLINGDYDQPVNCGNPEVHVKLARARQLELDDRQPARDRGRPAPAQARHHGRARQLGWAGTCATASSARSSIRERAARPRRHHPDRPGRQAQAQGGRGARPPRARARARRPRAGDGTRGGRGGGDDAAPCVRRPRTQPAEKGAAFCYSKSTL